jgi:hypothetical protein
LLVITRLSIPVIAFVLAAGGAARAAEPACAPVAIVEGPSAIADPTTAILRQHGVETDPKPCGGRVVWASLTASADTKGYSLRIQDGYGRANQRVASNPETAASLIESWVLAEDAELLVPRSLVGPEATTAVASAPVEQVSIQPDPQAVPRWRLLGAGELSVNNDNSSWYGGSVTGCHRVGAACLGGRLRVARGDEWERRFRGDRGDDDDMQRGLDRSSLEALAVAVFPIALGRMTFLPLAAIGGNWTNTAAIRAPNPTSRDDLVLRAEAALAVNVALVSRWSLVVEMAGAAGRSLYRESDQMFLPPPPTALMRLGIGLGFSQ